MEIAAGHEPIRAVRRHVSAVLIGMADINTGDAMAADAAAMAGAEIVVIHETDGRKYLEALAVLAEGGEIGGVAFHGASVIWRFAHCLLRERRKLRPALAIAGANLAFRCRMPFLRGKIIVLAIAPWDWRILLYAIVVPRNQVIYNTSWPWWDGDHVPRRYGFLTPLLRRVWRAVLMHPNVTLTTVTRPAAAALAAFLPGRAPLVIPHVVSRQFFAQRARRGENFKLLFVGELAEKKGFAQFAAILDQLGGEVGAEIVGDGPLRGLAKTLATRPGCRWHGKVTDRQRLAAIAAECQVFLSPARKTPKWEELFGMAIAESMALGLVCIVTDHIGPRSFIEHGINGVLVAQDDTSGIVTWVRALREDAARWEAMSQAATVTAAGFAMSEVAGLWRMLIRGLSHQPGPAAPG